MAKALDEVVDDLRQDVARWKMEAISLRAQGLTATAEQIEKFIANAELMLSRLDNADH